MSELGTRDVLEQVDARLDNVEQDLRALRTEMNTRFDRMQEVMNDRFQEVNARFERVYQEIGGLRTEMNTRFTWLYGLLVAVVLGVAGLWFK